MIKDIPKNYWKQRKKIILADKRPITPKRFQYALQYQPLSTEIFSIVKKHWHVLTNSYPDIPELQVANKAFQHNHSWGDQH